MINLDSYIKIDNIRNRLKESCKIVSSLDQADIMVEDVLSGSRNNILFEKSSYKNHFLSKMRINSTVKIINCNCSIDRFVENLTDAKDIVIFDNINNCSNIDILNILDNQKGIMIC